MGMGGKKVVAVYLCIVAAALVASTMGTMEEEEKECADQLTTLASCIPYVSGTAKKPTPQCCSDTQKVKSAKPKCLCVLIKESTDPSMGLPVNTTLALQMPSACNIDASVSDCPSLLNLPPDSPDAKIFKEGDAGSSTSSSATNSPPSSTSTTSSSSGSGSSLDSKATPTSSEGEKLNGCMFVIIMSLASMAWMFNI